MYTRHTAEDVVEFLSHAGDRGLMPAATAQALAVATRQVFSVLDESERADLPINDMDAVIRRFNNKRARDFNPTSLKEYGRRVKRAMEMYIRWKEDPASFTVKTRTTSAVKRKDRDVARGSLATEDTNADDVEARVAVGGAAAMGTAIVGYQTKFPVRQGQVVTVSNIPYDLSAPEAERLSQFIRMLAPIE